MPEGAAPQAGVFSGLNPAAFNPADPIVLFIIQVNERLIVCEASTIWIITPF